MSLENEELRRQEDYLKLLAQQYPDISSVCTEIINLNAILQPAQGHRAFHERPAWRRRGLPPYSQQRFRRHPGKGGHGFQLIPCRKRSGPGSPPSSTIPQEKLEEIKRDTVNMDDWYSITLYRLVEVCKLVASKYTRSKVRKAMPEALRLYSWTSCSIPTTTRKTSSPITSTSSPPLSISTGRTRSSSRLCHPHQAAGRGLPAHRGGYL